jgi:hypothetical protein
MIWGRSNSGKTTFLVNFILNQKYYELFEVIYVFCPSFYTQRTFKPLDEYVDPSNVYKRITKKTIKSMIATQKELDYPRALIIIDDQSAEKSLNEGSKGSFARFCTNMRWYNSSIIALVHGLTAVSTTLRDNLDHLIMLYVGNNRQLKKAYDEFSPVSKVIFNRIYKENIQNHESGHGFVHWDFRPPVTYYPQGRILRKPKRKKKKKKNYYDREIELYKHWDR